MAGMMLGSNQEIPVMKILTRIILAIVDVVRAEPVRRLLAQPKGAARVWAVCGGGSGKDHTRVKQLVTTDKTAAVDFCVMLPLCTHHCIC